MPKPLLIALAFGLTVVNAAAAHSGCCSHHSGVCGCLCCDGSLLSSTCLPFYTGCGSPSAPFGLTAVANSSSEAGLSWLNGSTSETACRIEAKADAGSFEQVGNCQANASSAIVGGLASQTTYTFRVFAENAYGDSPSSNEAMVTTPAGKGGCTADDSTLCLSSSRFQVRATFDTGSGNAGAAHAVSLTADTGYFWFFSSSNVEAVVKVIDGCALGGHYWVFAGGLTNVKVVLTVTDTRTQMARTYTNPPSTTFAPIQDTAAFSTCP